MSTHQRNLDAARQGHVADVVLRAKSCWREMELVARRNILAYASNGIGYFDLTVMGLFIIIVHNRTIKIGIVQFSLKP